MIVRKIGKERTEHFLFYGKLVAKSFVFLVFLFLLASLVSKFKTYFPIQSVKVYGVHHIDQQVLQETITPLVNKGFFAINVEAIKDRLLQSPWVAKATVQKIWPNQIAILLTEKTPIAHWNTKLITATGDIFSPELNSIPRGLPQLVGSEGEQQEILKHFRKLSSLLTNLHFKIARLELTPDHSWNVTMDNGMKMSMGYKDGLTRLGHFVKVYPKVIGNRFADVEYIDLRYTNGLAVRWKTLT